MAENRIGKLRREFDMNQRELGEQLGVGQTTVSAWETGKNEPDNEAMYKMAKLFHVSIGYLSGYENDEIYRGLSEKERDELFYETREKRGLERIAKETEREEAHSYEQFQECEEEEQREEWVKSGQTTYYEFFKLNRLGDFLTKDQRERALKVVQLMFPNAVKGKHTPE